MQFKAGAQGATSLAQIAHAPVLVGLEFSANYPDLPQAGHWYAKTAGKLNPSQIQKLVEIAQKVGRQERLNPSISSLQLQSRVRSVISLPEYANIGTGGNINLGSMDIMALAFIVLMEAAQSAAEDLKAIMAGVQAINAAKQALRASLSEVQNYAAGAGSSSGQSSVSVALSRTGSFAFHHKP